MAKMNLLCLALLLALVISINVSAESSSSSESKEKGTTAKGKKATTAADHSSETSEDRDDEATTAKATEATTAASKKVDRKAIDKLIVGNFELQTSLKAKDLNKLLKKMEFKEQDRDRLRNAGNLKVSIKKEAGKKQYSSWVTAGYAITFHNIWELGKEFEDTLFDGRRYKGTITFEGNNKVIKKEKHLGFNCHHVAEFDKKGYTITFDCDGTKAVQKYKRMKQEPKKQQNNEHQPPEFSFNFGR